MEVREYSVIWETICEELKEWMWRHEVPSDKGRIGLYMKLCDFTLLFMILQVELRLNKDH